MIRMSTARKVAIALKYGKPACNWKCLDWCRNEGAGPEWPNPDMCREKLDGFLCTLRKGHKGAHVACAAPGTIHHRAVRCWPKEKEQQP